MNTKIIQGYFPKEFFMIRKFAKKTRAIVKAAKKAKKYRDKNMLDIRGLLHHLDAIHLHNELENIDEKTLSLVGAIHYKNALKEFSIGFHKANEGLTEKVAKLEQLINLQSEESNTNENSKN